MSAFLTALNVTPLTGFISNGNKFDIEWFYTGAGPTYWEILRHVSPLTDIGPTMLDVSTFTSLATTVSSVITYADYLNDATDPEGIYTNAEVIDQIIHTQRKLTYSVRGVTTTETTAASCYINPPAFTLPYVTTTHNNGWLVNWSGKTQVVFNTLHLEGEQIWATKLTALGAGYLSRTAVDSNFYRNNSLNEGTVWVSDRGDGPHGGGGSSYVWRLDAHTGTVQHIYSLPGTSQTCGLCVDPRDGSCYAGGNSSVVYKLKLDNTEPVVISIPRSPWPYGIYGMASNPALPKQVGIVYGNGLKRHWDDPNMFIGDCDTGYAYPLNVQAYNAAYGSDSQLWMINAMDGYVRRYDGTTITAYSVYPDSRPHEYRGICIDNSTSSTSNYNVWIGDTNAWEINKFTWNGTTLTLNKRYTSLAYAPMGIGCDSENNLWTVEGHNCLHLDKIYQTTNASSAYPYGGGCRYPTGPYSSWSASTVINDAAIEYVLTRDPSTMAAPTLAAFNNLIETNIGTSETLTYNGTDYDRYTWGIKIKGSNTQEQHNNAVAFIAAYSADLTVTQGRRIYPNCPASIDTVIRFSFPTTPPVGDSYQYSDFTGYIAFAGDLSANNSIPIQPGSLVTTSYKFPDYTNPSFIDMSLSGIYSSPTLEDGTYWQNQINNANTIETSGYDDLTVRCKPDIYDGSFELSGIRYNFGDRDYDLGVTVPNSYITQVIPDLQQDYTYHDPSQSGKPNARWIGYPGEDSGTYFVNATAYYNHNVYLTGTNPQTTSNTEPGSATVWERWPTAQFYLTPLDTTSLRLWLWRESIYRAYGDNGLTPWSANRIISGTDPVSALFSDMSIARTWALSSWTIDFGDHNNYPAFFTSLGYTNSAFLDTVDASYSPKDATTLHANLTSHLYCRPGTYYATLFVRAINTETESAELNTMNIAATQEVRVYELEPFANFLTLAVSTVSSSYHDDATTPIWGQLYVDEPPVLNTVNLISGYAPNLTITWMECCMPHSYPISGYDWNFGDYYNEIQNLSSISALNVTVDYPCWETDQSYHRVIHTYVMPGIYNVTLCASASTTSTQSCCAKNLYVYVDELLPEACFTIGDSLTSFGVTPSGEAPLTVYFNPSCTIPGSFPICRMDWDFGDGTMTTVTRRPSTENTYGIYPFPSDLNDPRNIIVSHEFTRTLISQPSTFIVTMSAYACNTNTMDSTSGSFVTDYNVGPITVPAIDLSVGKRHIIASRSYNNEDDLLLVFEGENKPVTYSVLISGT